MQVTQVPNIVLNNLWIDNLTRSKAMKEVVEVNISYDTSFEDIELLRLEMEKFVRHPDNSRDFQQDLIIGVGGVNDLDKLTLKIVIKHKSNWHNESVRATRRSKFMCALALALKKVPIFGPGAGPEPPIGTHGNPSYAVTVDDTFASQAREKAAEEAEAKRMVPHPVEPKLSNTNTNRSGDGPKHISEAQAVEELNARPPLAGMESNFGFNRDDDDGGRSRSPPQPQMASASSPSLDSNQQYRAQGLEQIRADLVKRQSTRGRRRQGEGVPGTAFGAQKPGFSVTQYDNEGHAIVGSQRQMSYDVAEEPLQQNPYQGGSAYFSPPQPQVSPRVVDAAQESSSLYQNSGASQQQQQQQAVPPGYATPHAGEETGEGASAGVQHQGRLAPTASLSSARRGARPSGASVGTAEAEAEQATGRGDVRAAKKQFTK